MTSEIVTALICILGALLAIFIALLQIRQELRYLWDEGIHECIGMEIHKEDVEKITKLVIDELKRQSITIREDK